MTEANLLDEFDRQIQPALLRLRRSRRALRFAFLAATACLAGLILGLVTDQFGWFSQTPWWVLLAVAGVAATWVRAPAFRPSDRIVVARIIERANPELQGALLTAIDLRQTGSGRLTFLQEQLLRQTLGQAAPDDWARAIAPGTLTWSTVAASGFGAIFLVMAAAGIFPNWHMLLPDRYGMDVVPGHTEIERGTEVLVTVRFRKQVSPVATLVLRIPGQAAIRIPMARTLADPVFSAVTPPLMSGQARYQIETSDRRSAQFQITTFVHPDVDRIDAQVTYPRLSSRAPQDIKEIHALSVIEGARVTLIFRLTTPVNEARLQTEGKNPVALTLDHAGTEARTTVDPDSNRTYVLFLQDDRGRQPKQPTRIPIEVKRNLLPRITNIFPGRDTTASPIEEVAPVARISDDVAIVSYGVTFGLDDATARDVRLGGAATGETTAQALILLEDLAAAPRQILTFHFWADDQGPDGKIRRARGDLTFVDIRPFEETFREAPPNEGSAKAGPAAANLAEDQRKISNATWKLLRSAEQGVDPEQLTADARVVKQSQALNQQAALAQAAEADSEAQGVLQEAARAMAKAETALGGSIPQGLTEALPAEQKALALLSRLKRTERAVTRGKPGAGAGANSQDKEDLVDLDMKQAESRYETKRQAQAAAGEDEANEHRDLSSRLAELARRQKAMTEKLRDLSTAQSRSDPKEQEKQGIELKRLRDEQRDALADLDEARNRLADPEARQRQADTAAELDGTRKKAQATAEALSQGDAARALGQSAEVERSLDRANQRLRKQASQGFAEDVRQMRATANQLANEQERLAPQLQKSADATEPAGAASALDNKRLGEALSRQRVETRALLDQMQRVSENAEPTAPLLSRKLYEALRKAKNSSTLESLQRASQYTERNMTRDALPAIARAQKALSDLKSGVADAARGIIGDGTEALRNAQAGVNRLIDSLSQGEQGPITGDGYREFSDGLRDVVDLMANPAMRLSAARTADRARALRADFKRHSRIPDGQLLQEQLLTPLTELRDQLTEELRQASTANDLAPSDRDPVPTRYSDAVKRYWKSLATGAKP